MNYLDNHEEMISAAREHFKEGEYNQAEAIINQLILQNLKSAEVFHMLGTIYYDQGKFNKAIRAFKRALEVDPAFTDASVGLSIILNDLGRYDDGKKVFEEAKALLGKKTQDNDPYLNEKLSVKHDELGEMYFQYKRYQEALEQYHKALSLSARKAELSMKLIECYLKMDNVVRAIKDLQGLCKEYPEFVHARLKLGKVYYDSHRVPEAIEQWEYVLRKNPNHKQASELLKMAQSVEYTQHIELTP